MLDEALGLLDHHLGDLHVALRRPSNVDEITSVDRPLHAGDFFGPLVDEQHHQVDPGGPRHRLGDALQQHRPGAAAARRSGRAAPADRRPQIHDPRRYFGRLERDAFLRTERVRFSKNSFARLIGASKLTASTLISAK